MRLGEGQVGFGERPGRDVTFRPSRCLLGEAQGEKGISVTWAKEFFDVSGQASSCVNA